MSEHARDREGLESLLQFCRTNRAELLRSKIDRTVGLFCGPNVEPTIKQAVKTLIELGGLDLAEKLLDESMSFGDRGEAIRRLKEVEEWCQSRLQAPSPAESGDNSCTRFEVWDQETGKSVVFDKSNAECWGTGEAGEGWLLLEGMPEYMVEETLYRHSSGHWTLISEKCHFEAGTLGDPQARRLTDAEAADWLVRHDIDPPSDVAHLAPNSLFKPGPPLPEEQTKSDRQGTAKPRWDSERRELWLADQLCKRFKQPAPNQIRILDAFEESGWPSRIDDPIPPHRDSDRRQRLADAVRGLNSNQAILFELDGTGEGVVWRPIEEEPEDADIPF